MKIQIESPHPVLLEVKNLKKHLQNLKKQLMKNNYLLNSKAMRM